eukprot:GILI01016127.1.p1 GENE.GILI01016127.1~~GILI01016127.1.p1  ORF type:complete len:292 (+),score=85.72 GILI01016127.1:834-1709(+)
MSVRRASHSGSWYSADAAELESQLEAWLAAAQFSENAARAIIAPHAGYRYSGPTAAWAYRHIDPSAISRVFLLGPSHHHYLDCCALSSCVSYATPLGSIPVDSRTVAALKSAGEFEVMSKQVDEDEHSLEMHLPFIKKVMQGHPFTLVPILVGSLDDASERYYGSLLAPYLADPSNLFVISSDFCHWGERFQYQRVDRDAPSIAASIEALDRRGMAVIEQQDPRGWRSYLKETRNTVCGRHPIGVLLQAISQCPLPLHTKFVHYAQSSACQSMQDSSVSYAASVTSLPSDA